MKFWGNRKNMRSILFLLFLTIGLSSCEETTVNSSTSKTPNKRDSISQKPKSGVEVYFGERDYLEVYAQEIKLLDSLYGKPVFLFLNRKTPYFITSKNESQEGFSEKEEFGLADGNGKIILDFSYSKIYNMHQSLKNCLELKSNGKIGLLNIETKEVLPPIFEFILAEKGAFSNIGYGYLGQKWYRIHKDSLLDFRPINFNPTPFLSNYEYDNANTAKHFFYNLETKESYIPTAFVTYPSVIEFVYSDSAISGPNGQYFYHFEEPPSFQAKVSDQRKKDGETNSFLISLIYEYVEGRGTIIESEHLVVYNSLNMLFEKRIRRNDFGNNTPCIDSHTRFVNDSILETKYVDGAKDFDSTHGKYFLGNDYEFLKIKANGEIQNLKTNREFAFTKFVLIDATYFKSCFIQQIPKEIIVDNDAWQSDHLTIEDLDLMRNEIYADYGLIFKSEKWSEYFELTPWYQGKYENVDHLLSPIDKENILAILEAKKELLKNEKSMVNRREIIYEVYP